MALDFHGAEWGALRRKPPFGGWRRIVAVFLAALLLTVATVARANWEVRNTQLVETTFVTDELVGELRVVQITDFHSLPRPSQVDQIVELVRGAEPDLIALTGDFVNTSRDDLEPVEHLVSGLATIDAPRFYVDGNHDQGEGVQGRLHALLESYGVRVLANENLFVDGDFGEVQLVGVDDYYSGHGDLGAAVAGLPGDGFRMVLTHSPQILPELNRYGVDYALCGHTHGGQVRVPVIGPLYQAGGDYFPKISKGVYTDGDATLFIDSGVGVTGPAVRFLNQSQITLHRIGPA
ncbi:MAG: metallophosphoesterase [Tessaracoccus sp.]|uniref:metallophosphoesterase n=1 Tax=Tessaracoccus sp. TaxID=1971211 RepID=UPI001EB385FB|nr:metallophosphoesterase [Tessaracoccus sp.]MBK7820547.1 metallophosphoesterase [Tessaracoccus sp.]